jgi:hypothetical protein
MRSKKPEHIVKLVSDAYQAAKKIEKDLGVTENKQGLDTTIVASDTTTVTKMQQINPPVTKFSFEKVQGDFVSRKLVSGGIYDDNGSNAIVIDKYGKTREMKFKYKKGFDKWYKYGENWVFISYEIWSFTDKEGNMGEVLMWVYEGTHFKIIFENKQGADTPKVASDKPTTDITKQKKVVVEIWSAIDQGGVYTMYKYSDGSKSYRFAGIRGTRDIEGPTMPGYNWVKQYPK